MRVKKPNFLTTELSDTALSNLFTMGIASTVDGRQAIPDQYGVPIADVRELRARLIMEEAMETCKALGVVVGVRIPTFRDTPAKLIPEFISTELKDLQFACSDCIEAEWYQTDLDDIIDGCCDTIYVCVGTLIACGAPDVPHLEEVNMANNAKFPGGKALFNESGKFLKPPGWRPPSHENVRKKQEAPCLNKIARDLIISASQQERA